MDETDDTTPASPADLSERDLGILEKRIATLRSNIDTMLPGSRETALALTKIDETLLWVRRSVELNGSAAAVQRAQDEALSAAADAI